MVGTIIIIYSAYFFPLYRTSCFLRKDLIRDVTRGTSAATTTDSSKALRSKKLLPYYKIILYTCYFCSYF